MITRTITRLSFAIGAGAFIAPALLAVDIALSAEIRLGKVLPPPPPEVVVIEESGPKGPPPWAPAHGFRRNREYYYYPGANVYFRPTDRTWFYLEGRDWRIGATLPTSIRVDLDRSVSLTMETERPFDFHEQIQTYYPPTYFTKKVKIKNPHSAAAGKPDKPEKVREEKPGKGKGKGK